MKILLVSATDNEIAPLLSSIDTVTSKRDQLDVLVTGAGMVATAYFLGKQLSLQKYDLAVNAGIAGSFDRNLLIGEVVQVSEDIFAEMGAEDGDDFLPIDMLGFGESKMLPAHPTPDTGLKQVKAITVSRVHGNETTIYNTMSRFHPQIESMEGASFFYCCNQANIPCVQIRAISNYVERRNRENWNISLAIENLNGTLSDWLKKLV